MTAPRRLRCPYPRDGHPLDSYLARLGSEQSRRTMQSALEVAARIIGERRPRRRPARLLAWHRLRYQDAELLRAELVKRYKPATARKVLSAFRGIVRAAWRLGHLSSDQAERLVDVGSVRGRTLPPGRTLTPEELGELVGACYAELGDLQGRRDAAVVLFMYYAGLRREEVRGLDLADVDVEARVVKVVGKGNKERAVPLRLEVLEALEVWLGDRGSKAGPLFTTAAGGRLSPSAINRLVEKRARAAELEHVTPHDLRRTFVTELLEAEVDVLRVRELAGHEDLATTARYDRRGDAALRRAVDRLPTTRTFRAGGSALRNQRKEPRKPLIADTTKNNESVDGTPAAHPAGLPSSPSEERRTTTP